MSESVPFVFSYPITVHLRDTDGLGHVNNAVYMTYLETARNRWVFELTGKKEVRDFDFILAHTTIDFKSAANLYDQLEVSLRPLRIGNSSWELGYEIRERGSGRLVVAARSVQVSYDYAAEKPMAVPARLRAALEVALAGKGGSEERL